MPEAWAPGIQESRRQPPPPTQTQKSNSHPHPDPGVQAPPPTKTQESQLPASLNRGPKNCGSQSLLLQTPDLVTNSQGNFVERGEHISFIKWLTNPPEAGTGL